MIFGVPGAAPTIKAPVAAIPETIMDAAADGDPAVAAQCGAGAAASIFKVISARTCPRVEAAVRETHAGPRLRASRAFGTGRTRSTGRKRLDID